MTYYPKKYWKIKAFHKSWTAHKKYAVILAHKYNGNTRTLHFGDKRYQHYRDSTPLKLYKKLDHLDKTRRERYIKRHKKFIKKGYFSPGQMSMDYLW